MSAAVLRGSVLYLYAFDVADEIRTGDVRELLAARPTPFRLRPATALPIDVQIYEPLLISSPAEEQETSQGRLRMATSVKVFEVGALSIAYLAPFEVSSLRDLIAFHQLRVGGRELSDVAEALCGRVAADLGPALARPNRERPPAEAYTVFCLEAIEGVAEAELPAWAEGRREEIAALLSEEPLSRLSPAQVAETTRHWLSYSLGDLTVIDWDAALAVDLGGSFDDVAYVMELANVQLEEFRILGDRLDAVALRLYDDLERHYARRSHFRVPTQILANLRTIRVDITKMSEQAGNITKFVGDWYLARVYLACKDRFHLGHWQSSVAGKLRELDDLYSLVRSEVEGRRMLLLEATIVALFVIDIVFLLLLG